MTINVFCQGCGDLIDDVVALAEQGYDLPDLYCTRCLDILIPLVRCAIERAIEQPSGTSLSKTLDFPSKDEGSYPSFRSKDG